VGATMDIRRMVAAAGVFAAAVLLLALAAPDPAQAGSKCRAKTALPESVSTAKAENSVLCLLNKERSKRGLPKLERQGELDRASFDHSQLMVNSGCFAHDCPGEPNLFQRLVSAGYLTGLGNLLRWGYGENIAWGSGELGTPKSIVKAWMNSEGHRENILNRDFEQIGVGLVWGSPAGGSLAAATYTTDFGYRNG
jgi:uncharacterized protein YkwD